MRENKKKSSNNHYGKLANTKKAIANRKKASPLNQINRNGEAFDLSRCLQMRKKKKKKSAPFIQPCKGKSVSTNITEQQMDIDQEAIGIQFHEEIIMEILSRLPVQSLLRFKCISKFWKALISDSYFMMNHLNHAKNYQNSQKFLVSQKCRGKDDMFNFYCSSLSSVQVVEDEQKLNCPSICKPVSSKIYCSCDGLVFLSVTDRIVTQLLLWNPSTRESILLPHPESPLRNRVCGLGYDATSDGYKILAINVDPMSDGDDIFTEILALKSDSWRKNCKYPTGIRRVVGFFGCGQDYLAFLHGAFHWLGLSQCYTIVSFNISSEVYGEIPLPERMCNLFYARNIEHGISVLGGMLCFYSTYNTHGNGTFKLWVMKDYGVEESWTELLTVRDTNLFYSGIPRYMFADGEVLLHCRTMGSLDSVYTTSRGPFGLWPQHVTLENVTFKQGITYTESLIAPKLLI